MNGAGQEYAGDSESLMTVEDAIEKFCQIFFHLNSPKLRQQIAGSLGIICTGAYFIAFEPVCRRIKSMWVQNFLIKIFHDNGRLLESSRDAGYSDDVKNGW